jgi:hypothetical protein
MYVWGNTEASSGNQRCSEKAVSITYSECVFVALGIQHAMRMCRVILKSVASSALQRFTALSDKRHDFRENVIDQRNVRFDFLYKICLQLSFHEEMSETYKKFILFCT